MTGIRGSIIIFFIIVLSGVRLSPLGTAANIGLLYQPHIIDNGACGAIGGMKIGCRNRSPGRKPELWRGLRGNSVQT
jgi:hypothetical protein